MDPSNVREEATKLVRGLTSLDPVEYNSAINQYFQPSAAIDNSFLLIRGAQGIKKFTALQADIAQSNEVVGEPKYDESKQLIQFTLKRSFKTPPILPFLPVIGSYFTGDKGMYSCSGTLQLVPEHDSDAKQGEGKKLVVSKLAVTEPPAPPLLNKLSYTLLRPFFSFVAIAISTVASFYHRHINDSWFAMALAAISETYNGMWKVIGDERSKREAQANDWSTAKGDDLRKLIEQAKATGAGLQSNIEAQAKARGIPVEEYKRQAENVINDLAQKVSVATHYFEEQADTAKAQVKEYVNAAANSTRQAAKEAENQAGEPGQTVKDNAKQYADEAKKTAETAKEATKEYAAETKDNVETAVNNAEDKDQSEEHGAHDEENHADGARTPLGGTDPLADGAPSYAQAVKE